MNRIGSGGTDPPTTLVERIDRTASRIETRRVFIANSELRMGRCDEFAVR
jgi:hypothetical protein